MFNIPPSSNLAAAELHTPIRQGRLDYLCGLYAMINAIRLAAPAATLQKQAMFEKGIEYLDDRGWLGSVLTEGMPVRLFTSLARHLLRPTGGGILRLTTPTATSTDMDPREWAILSAIAHGHPVIIAVDGPLNHYSVIQGYTPQRFHLFDSFGYRWLNRKNCGYGRQAMKRHKITSWVIPEANSEPFPQKPMLSYAA